MTKGEAFVASHALKTVFYDRHEERVYRRAIVLAQRIVDEPELIARGEAFLEDHIRGDPHQRAIFKKWKSLLAAPAEVIASALLDDTPAADELRNTAPVFFTLTPSAAKSLWVGVK